MAKADADVPLPKKTNKRDRIASILGVSQPEETIVNVPKQVRLFFCNLVIFLVSYYRFINYYRFICYYRFISCSTYFLIIFFLLLCIFNCYVNIGSPVLCYHRLGVIGSSVIIGSSVNIGSLVFCPVLS